MKNWPPEDLNFPGCYAMSIGKQVLTFRQIVETLKIW